MPSVGMRRTTRVFGARVLRSGRRLLTGPVKEVKHMRAAAIGDDWIELLDNSVSNFQGQCKENRWHDDDDLNQETTDEMDIDRKREPRLGKTLQMGLVDNNVWEDRRWGAVYARKRKRTASKSSGFLIHSENNSSTDRRYGKHFFRKQTRKKIRETPISETCDLKSGFVGGNFSQVSFTCRLLVTFVESSPSSRYWFSCFLSSILRYMRRARVSLPQLSAFLFSELIAHAFSSHGIHFLQDSTSIKSSGVCKIFGSRSSVPLFAVDFSAIPICFICLHSSFLLRSAFLPNILLVQSMCLELMDNRMIDEEKLLIAEEQLPIDEELPSCNSFEKDQFVSKSVAVVDGISWNGKLLHTTTSVPKIAGRTLQTKNGVRTRSIRKRSSLRSRRCRNPSGFGMRKANKALVADLFSKQDGIRFFPKKANPELMSSVRRSSPTNIKELKSALVGLTQDIDSASCTANILVIESDKCCREEGAVITLEASASQQWFLVVKRNGIKRFRLVAQKFMRPCSCNRITHAIIWTGDYDWKLEFPNRQDWFIFKALYRKCSELNVHTATVCIIPVPGVHEVLGYADCGTVPFRLPDSYITLKDDEVTRALEKTTATYDMDSDDEEWLNKFNNESCPENEPDKRVSEDSFELIIDAFERGFYFNPDDYSDVNATVDRCMRLATREVLESMYSYWMKKRKLKRSALVRIFQCYQPRRAELFLPKAVFRKKRTFKPRPSHSGRGKHRTVLKDEQDAVTAQNSFTKLQEAKAASTRSEGVAVLKRQRTQLLMETADLATYKATMALRIAEAAALAFESPVAGDAASFSF